MLIPHPATAPTTLTGLGDGALARQFRTVRFLGAGPDGTAVAAQRADGSADVELRFVQEHAQTNELLERWSRYQLLDHPNVISLLQVENAGEQWCAVLDTAVLRTLAQLLAAGVPAEAGLKMLKQVASALAAAHELGIWHGNVVASSVGLDAQLRVRLEFTGVSIWSQTPAEQSLMPRWQDLDGSDDVLGLALLAEQLLSGSQTVFEQLDWVSQARETDPLKRPSAAAVERSLKRLCDRRATDRRQLEALQTEPPEARGATQMTGSARRVGRFELEQLLGEGGMGSVYRARDVASGQIVALKVLREDLISHESVQYRFKKEARVLKEVRSPYIANLVEAEITDKHGYIALEFVDGEDLASAFGNRGEALSESTALQIVSDVCRALIEPHRRGIVHRDIKPQNILLVGTLADPGALAIKLCDFGIASARLTPETMGMTQDGLLGTPQYMSPEQCTSSQITPATDVYALGLTLYELIAGRAAFEAADLIQVLRQQMTEQPRKLSDCAAVSDGTVAVVERALNKDPKQRFADATELLEAIEAVRDGQSASLSIAQSGSSHGRVYSTEFSVDLASDGRDLWPYISDTDRMNEVIGLPPVQVERANSKDGNKTILSNKVLGMNLRWEEHPFEWIEGQGWSVYRRFESGLMRWYRVRLELQPLPGGGTRVSYRMEFEPLFSLLAWVIKLEVGVKQKAKLTRVFQRVDALIADGTVRRTPSPHASPEQPDAKTTRQVAAKLETLRLAGVEPPALKAMHKHVLFGSHAEIARLRPLRFARVHGLDERTFTEACLLAAREGLFNILWDVLCPLCQIPASFAESLDRLESHSECPACALSFPLKFAESVELVFRVAPDVRANEVQAYCIGGPAHSPHVAAQLRLAAGEARVLPLELSDGRHRIRSPQLPGVIELEVQAEHAFSRADLVVGSRLRAVAQAERASEDPRLRLSSVDPSVRLASGRQTLALRNELPHEVTVRIERTTDRDDALTAARAWAMPKFRELFPGETLEAGRLAAIGELSFLVLRVVDHLALLDRRGDAMALADTVRAIDKLQSTLQRHHGRLASLTMDVAVATFERAGDALDASMDLWDQLSGEADNLCSLTLHRGAAVATTIDDRMAYYGRAILQTLDLSASIRAGELALSAAAIGEDLYRVNSPAPRRVEPAPMLGPAAWVMRFLSGLAPANENHAALDPERVASSPHDSSV